MRENHFYLQNIYINISIGKCMSNVQFYINIILYLQFHINNTYSLKFCISITFIHKCNICKRWISSLKIWQHKYVLLTHCKLCAYLLIHSPKSISNLIFESIYINHRFHQNPPTSISVDEDTILISHVQYRFIFTFNIDGVIMYR